MLFALILFFFISFFHFLVWSFLYLTTNPFCCNTDVREPSELIQTGYIPTAKNIPLKTSFTDALSLSAEDFEDRFDFPRPDANQEVVFYCLGGVRSRMAAQMAREAGFAGAVGDYSGSWEDWIEKGGEVAR